MILVKSRARAEYKDDGLVEFHRLREERLQTLPLDLLSTTPIDKSSEPEQQNTGEILTILEVQEQVQVQTQEHSHMETIADTQIDPKLLQEWQQFDSIIRNLGSPKETETLKAAREQEIVSIPVSIETSGPPIAKEIEVIPKDPSQQIILQI